MTLTLRKEICILYVSYQMVMSLHSAGTITLMSYFPRLITGRITKIIYMDFLIISLDVNFDCLLRLIIMPWREG